MFGIFMMTILFILFGTHLYHQTRHRRAEQRISKLEELLNKYEIWYENKLESVNDTSIKTKPTKTKAKSKSNKTIKKKKSIIV